MTTSMAAPRPESQFVSHLRAFTGTHAREMFRDRRAVVTVAVSFAAFLVLFWGVDLLVSRATGTDADFLLLSLPLLSAIAFMTVAFSLTTVPLVNYRGIGVLRALATTPAHATAFVLGHLPIRAGILGVETIIILAIAAAHGVSLPNIGALALTLMLGGAMLLSFGYLLATRMSNQDAALQLSYLLPLVVLATSGTTLAENIVPDWLVRVCEALPTTWFIDAAGSILRGSTPGAPLPLLWAGMAVITVAASYATFRMFQWTPED